MSFENIHIAILGPVSAGKSTFLNALFSNTFSDMKRKKTTMLPQIYKTTMNKDIIDSQDEIYEKNRLSNETILKLREENKYNQSDFKELEYNVECIDDFIKLPDSNATYSILDMPGLNCGGGDNMYFNYISQVSKYIDIYILVFDINSGLNTTDEVNILNVIATEIKKNKYGYVHIIINKCDDVIYDNNSFKFNDDELQELYDRCIETTNKYFKDIKDICNVSISPLCASDLYVFRSIKNNIESIDEKHLDKIIMNESGKKELNKLSSLSNKQKYIQGLIKQKKSTLFDDWMKDTGYNMFQTSLSNINSNYCKMVEHHIIIELNNILLINITDLDTITNKLISINDSLLKLSTIDKTYIKSEIIEGLINKNTVKINQYINSGIDSYSASTLEKADSFIIKIGKFADKIKNWFKGSNPFDETKTKLIDKRYLLLNNQLLTKYDEKIFCELYKKSKLDITKFKSSIDATLVVNSEEQYMPQIIIRLLKSIYKITNNDDYISIVLDIYFSNDIINKRTQVIPIAWIEIHPLYNLGKEFSEYYKYTEQLFIEISKVSTHKTEYIIKLLETYTKDILLKNGLSQDINNDIYKYWYNTHLYLFNQIPEINYIYYNFGKIITNTTYVNGLVNIDRFNNVYKRMENVFNILVNIYSNNNLHIQNEELYLSVDEELQESEEIPKHKSEEINSDTTEDYSDNDDDTKVYEKASRNASIRLNKTIKLGSKK